jgi:hypothetical protein
MSVPHGTIRHMISIDGAGLLAQVYPVGLLVVGLEGRGILARTLKDVLPRQDPKKFWLSRKEAWTARNTYETLWTISIMWTLGAEVLCLWSVCNNLPLAEAWTWLVATAGFFLGVTVLATLMRAVRVSDAESKASAQ